MRYPGQVGDTARDWLIDGAPGASTSDEVLAGVCERLRAAGVPVDRADAYVRTLHPQFAGRAFVWEPGRGTRAIETDYASDAGRDRTMIDHVRDVRAPARHRFGPGDPRCTFTDELAALGMTDVVGVPLVFLSGEVHVCTFATTRASGFMEADVAALEGVMAPLSRVAEILALRRVAANVLTAYVGRDAGARVLAGKIRRGDTELIEAAIWFSDMRGFSTASHDKRPEDVIAMLNELFDCQLPAIERHGGEVLKFIGDGVLAIFTPGEGGLAACCRRALAASHEAVQAMHARGTIRFGIALHVGEVAYGNIGGESRLDFTCIGRAVNLAARLESLTGKTGRDVLASEELVRALGGTGFERVGDFEVKGFANPIAAYAP